VASGISKSRGLLASFKFISLAKLAEEETEASYFAEDFASSFFEKNLLNISNQITPNKKLN
jgi:hypothetical protein